MTRKTEVLNNNLLMGLNIRMKITKMHLFLYQTRKIIWSDFEPKYVNREFGTNFDMIFLVIISGFGISTALQNREL